MARRKITLPVVHSQANPSTQRSKKPNPSRPLRARPQKFTLAEAFSPFTTIGGEKDTPFDANIERGLRAVAFLLHSLSDIGNEDVEGFVAHGFGYVLEHYADRVDRIAERKAEV